MHIGIDGRLIEETGVGRYIQNLIYWLGKIDKKNSYTLYVTEKSFNNVSLPNPLWKKKILNIAWHSAQEQFFLPLKISQDKLNVFHVPYFTIPLLYFGNVVVTIHDLTILHMHTGKASTLPAWKYELRYAGYKTVLSLGLKKAKHILTVSETTKKELCTHYHIPNEKITVTHEGVDEGLATKNAERTAFSYPFILYVGNVYPHKNFELLLEAISLGITRKKHFFHNGGKLVVVAKDDFFVQRMKNKIKKKHLEDKVEFVSNISDRRLIGLYTDARALVFPSQMEGFGLPLLEALYFDTKVLASDIPIFRELAGNIVGVTLLPKDSPEAWIHAIDDVMSKKQEKNIWSSKKEKADYFSKFSWKNLAQKTLTVYENSIRI